jgi:hypothetical protein
MQLLAEPPKEVQGATLDVFSALANAQSLRHLNLYRNSGLTGPLVPPLAPLTGGLCQLARRSLNTLTADGISLTGGIPACLVNNGSRLVELHLGERCARPQAHMLIYCICTSSLLLLRHKESCLRCASRMRSSLLPCSEQDSHCCSAALQGTTT